jgi:hypothetical protein
VPRAQTLCSATGDEAPADPAGGRGVAVERTDVGTVAARRALNYLAGRPAVGCGRPMTWTLGTSMLTPGNP